MRTKAQLIARRNILEKAARLIQAGWTTGHLAKGSYGMPINHLSPYACKFCASGAILAAGGINGTGSEVLGLDMYTDIWQWNDNSSQPIVLYTFHKAIEATDAEIAALSS